MHREYWKTSIPCKMVTNGKLVCSICKKDNPAYVIRIGFKDEDEFNICHYCAQDINKATYCITFCGEETVDPEEGYPVPARYDI